MGDVVDRPEWSRAARDLGRALRDREPLTVLVGAGASLSSGAPSYAAVNDLLATKIATRLDPAHLPDELHTVEDRDKEAGLAAAFSAVVPGVGYRCLASLARDRPVTVLDLNWDTTAEEAARRLRLPCVAYDVRDVGARPSTRPARGLVVPHLHGDLRAPRVGRGEKPSFDPATVQHLAAMYGGGRLLVVGASLDEDHDVRQLLLQLQPSSGVWGFYRDATTGAALRHRNALPSQSPAVYADPDVDFDRLMLLVVDEALSPAWSAHQKAHAHLALPDFEDVVLPRRGVLVPTLDAHAAVLVGDPQLGKTTLAHLIAHLRVVWAQAGAVHVASGAQAGLAAVAVSGQSCADDVVVVENPFGEAPDQAPNPHFHQAVSAWAAAPDRPALLIASRTGDWQEPDVWPDGVMRSSPAPEDWYKLEKLQRFADAIGGGTLPRADVRPGFLDTPGRGA